MIFEYKKAELSDLNSIMQIFKEAQTFMEKMGNPQWERGFPANSDVLGGISGGIIYVATADGEIAGVFSVVYYDRDYDYIEGKWLSDGDYLAVHRVAVSNKFRGKGVAKFILKAAEQIARETGRKSLRFDTHEKNVPMLNLLQSNGFTACGNIKLIRNETKRIAFEKII